ncbi:prolyl aminopeptidase [Dokdonella koreensis]|uniref:Proline iminopeptidase n=1 Tax=Dokdonella koreensis DS-123 TaxID=1300342 RepID=A0A160DWU3_9GAMM|nr:prolyl aminopeptidase [Dokdonella koreensis]ANB19127.1 Proline iminopeptidase [Dokdonella koreensis DS-123]
MLHAAIDPFDQGLLATGDGHTLHYEQVGRVDGVPAVFLHGGPGSGCSPRQRRFFDPQRYRAVLFDQRGCGRSTPRGDTRHNTTAHLVEDIERLREHLGIDRWLVVGGSWGSALALAYAGHHRERVAGLLLRGVFLTGRADTDWFFHGVRALAPDDWERFAAHFPRRHRRNLLDACARVFARGDADAVVRTAYAWSLYEHRLLDPAAPQAGPALSADLLATLVDRYRVQIHYLARRCFLGERTLLGHAAGLHGIPMAIVHGREDRVCRPLAAWRLHRSVAGSRLALVAGGGHDPFAPAMATAFVGALDAFAGTGDFSGWMPA